MLDPFTYLKPGPFIAKYQDWITFTLLLAFFISIVGLALHKRFQGARYLKPLIITTGLMLAVGTYFGIYRGWLHISFAGLGLFGAILIFIAIFFVVFGLVKGFGMHTWNALPLGFCLFYISLWAVSPNIFDTLSRRIPIVNGILLILFIISIVKTFSGFMHHSKSPEPWALDLKRNDVIPADAPQIDNEIKSEKIERKNIKKKTLKLSKSELKDVKQIDASLKDIQQILETRKDLSQDDKQQIVKELSRIAKTKADFENSLLRVRKHIERFKAKDRKDAAELEARYHKTTDPHKKREIKTEWDYEKKKLEIFNFIATYNDRITSYLKMFDTRMRAAVSYMQNNQLNLATHMIRNIRSDLANTKTILEKIKSYERYSVKLAKKEEQQLQTERKGK